MNPPDLKRFEELFDKYETGDREAALRELREFARDIDEPWEKTELIYYEALWLLDLKRVTEARASLERFREGVADLVPEPPEDDTDDTETVLPLRLTVEMLSAEVKVLFFEDNNRGALQKLEELLSRYPKRLSTEHFFGIYEQMQTYRGLLLANLDRWDEAKPFLERATSPANWMNIVTFYLGQCYYSLGDYLGAKSQLLQALDMRLEPIWAARAHYLLGIVSHNLKDEKFAKHQFELCLKFGPPEYLATTRIWEWLEATSLRLGLHDQAEVYKRRRRINSTIQ